MILLSFLYHKVRIGCPPDVFKPKEEIMNDLVKNQTAKVFDRSVIKNYLLDDNEAEALNIFSRCSHKLIENMESRLDHLRESYQNNDREGIHFSLHLLKGSSLALGANKIVDLCIQIEDSLFTLSHESLGEQIEELVVMCRLFKQELEEYVNEIDAKFNLRTSI